MSVNERLCRAFVSQAIETWSFLDVGHSHRLLPGEETITDVNLLRLADAAPDVIFAKRFRVTKKALALVRIGSGGWVGRTVGWASGSRRRS